MYFDFLKTCRLGRLQFLVVWLILGVDFYKTEASLKCYSCVGDACKTVPHPDTPCDTGFCEKITEGDTITLQCSSAAEEAKCILNEFSGCYTSSEDNQVKLKKCLGDTELGESAKRAGVKICSCNSDHCNNAEDKATTGAPAKNDDNNRKPVERQGLDNLAKCYYCGDKDSCSENKEYPCIAKYCMTVQKSSGEVLSKGCPLLNDERANKWNECTERFGSEDGCIAGGTSATECWTAVTGTGTGTGDGSWEDISEKYEEFKKKLEEASKKTGGGGSGGNGGYGGGGGYGGYGGGGYGGNPYSKNARQGQPDLKDYFSDVDADICLCRGSLCNDKKNKSSGERTIANHKMIYVLTMIIAANWVQLFGKEVTNLLP